jgi:chorismate mutase
MIKMELSEISQRLESFEETIVFKLIDRAQFSVNEIIYKHGKSGFRGAGNASLLELRLGFQERIDAQFGKFSLPEEQIFMKKTTSRGAKHSESEVLIDNYNAINLTEEIMQAYVSLVPLICAEGDDGHHGSSVEHDVYALQAISRRIHFGSFYAAECKYKSDPEGFGHLINSNDQEGLLQKLTRKDVEERIIQRIQEKTESAQKLANINIRKVIKPGIVVDFYRHHIIPLTKKGQVLYLLNRKRKSKTSFLKYTPFFLLSRLERGRQAATAGAC